MHQKTTTKTITNIYKQNQLTKYYEHGIFLRVQIWRRLLTAFALNQFLFMCFPCFFFLLAFGDLSVEQLWQYSNTAMTVIRTWISVTQCHQFAAPCHTLEFKFAQFSSFVLIFLIQIILFEIFQDLLLLIRSQPEKYSNQKTVWVTFF